MSARQTFIRINKQGPTEILDYTLDWSDIMTLIDDEIVDTQHAVRHYDADAPDLDDPDAMRIDTSQFTSMDTTHRVTGGIPGEKYVATTTVRTREDRVFVRSELIRCIRR